MASSDVGLPRPGPGHQGKDESWTTRLSLWPLGPNDLPPHQDLATHQTSPPSLPSFLSQLFREAYHQFNTIRPQWIGTSNHSVSANGTTYPIVVRKSKCKDDDGLLWFGRCSEHSEVGYEDLRDLLMRNHEKNEAGYTPAIYDVNVLVDWEEHLKGMEFKCGSDLIYDVEMRVSQMHHKMPGIGLNDRVFTVLLASCTHGHSALGKEAIDIQIPIDLSVFPADVLSRSHSHANIASASGLPKRLIYQNNDIDASPEQKSRNGKAVVEGKYVSWERLTFNLVRPNEKTEWEMRTASDAGGMLPAWMQRMGVPGAIVKDVPLAVKVALKRKQD